ncbi:MAG: hypothetical protein SFW09_04225 [Hyphomicrobiaceae bacterium]|nr:hypothetical protein [Hyphomicrobiaceae bacterium]
MRRRLPAQSTLFEPGDAARRYYMVESGRLLVRGGTLGQPPAMTIACDGTLLIYDCGETHVVSCHVVTASVVLVVDRRRLERAAETDAALMGALRSAHAGELGMILKSLGITQVPYRSVRPGAPSRRMRQPELRLISGRPRSALDAGPGRSRPAHTGS